MVIMDEMLHCYITDEKTLEQLAKEYEYPLTELENIAEKGRWTYRREVFKLKLKELSNGK